DAALYSRIRNLAQSIEEPSLVKTPAPVLVRISKHQHEIAGNSQLFCDSLTPGHTFFYIFGDKILDVLSMTVKQVNQVFCYALVLNFMAEENGVRGTRVCRRGSVHFSLPCSYSSVWERCAVLDVPVSNDG